MSGNNPLDRAIQSINDKQQQENNNSQKVLEGKTILDKALSNIVEKDKGFQPSTGTESNIKIDEYAPYVGQVFVNEALDRERARSQSGLEQLGHATGRVLVNTLPTVVSNLASIADIEDYLNKDKEVGNAVTRAIESFKENVNESLPIYRENPGKPLDIGDSGWWYENGAGLVESAAAFVATGYITGGLAVAGLTRGAQAAKWLSGLGSNLARGGSAERAISGASTVLNAVGLNQAESIGVATTVYDKVYADALKEGMTPEKARGKAADAASYSINLNRSNILLNLTSASLFTKPVSFTRKLIKNPSLKRSAGRIAAEGAQEYTEEVINLYSENTAIDYAKESGKKEFNLKDVVSTGMTLEGLEAGLLGFVGGVAQTGGSLALKGKERKNQTERYNIQQEDITKFNNIQEQLYQSGNTIKDVGELFDSYTEQVNILGRINELQTSDDPVDHSKAEALTEVLLSKNAFRAFNNGTTESLINTYESLKNLTPEEAAERGFPKNYQERLTNAISKINKLEGVFLEATQYDDVAGVYNKGAELIHYETAKTQHDTFLLEAETDAQNSISTKYPNELKYKTEEGLDAEVPFLIDDLVSPDKKMSELQTQKEKDLFESFYNRVTELPEVRKYITRKIQNKGLERKIDDTKTEFEYRKTPDYQSSYVQELKEREQEQIKEVNKQTAIQENSKTALLNNEEQVDQEQNQSNQETPTIQEVTSDNLFEDQDQDQNENQDQDQQNQVEPVDLTTITSKSSLNKLKKAQLIQLAESFIPDTVDASEKVLPNDTKKDIVDKLSPYILKETEGRKNRSKVKKAVTDSFDPETDHNYTLSKDKKLENIVDAVVSERDPEDTTTEDNPFKLPTTGANVLANSSMEYEENEAGIVVGNANDVIKTTYNKNILSPDYLTEETPLIYEVVNSYVDEETGENITIEELREREINEGLPENSLIPIRVTNAMDGETVGYIHNIEWINPTRISPKHITDERNRLMAIRNRIVSNGGRATGNVSEKSAGKLFVRSDKKYVSLNQAFKNPNIEFGYVSSAAQIVTGRTVDGTPTYAKTKNNLNHLKDMVGYTVVVLTRSDGSKLAVPVKINKVSSDHALTIRRAVAAYLDPTSETNAKTIEEIRNKMAIDLSNTNGLREFIRTFIRNYTDSSNLSFTESLRIKAETEEIKSDFNALTVTPNGIEFGTAGKPMDATEGGTPASVLYLTRQILDTENGRAKMNAILDVLEKHLQNMYYGINKENLGDGAFLLPTINADGSVKINNTQYSEFIKSVSRTNLGEIDLGNGNFVYTIQPRAYFSVLGMDSENINPNTFGSSVVPSTADTTTSKTDIVSPDGIKLEDITESDLDFSENIDESGKREGNNTGTTNIENSKLLISGLSVTKQEMVIKGISADISNKIIDSPSAISNNEDSLTEEVIEPALQEWKNYFEAVSKEDIPVAKDAKAIFDNWESKVVPFIKYAIGQKKYIESDYDITGTNLSDEIEGLNDADKEQTQQFDDFSSFKINHKKTAPLRLRRFLSTIRDYSNQNKYLVAAYYDYDEVYNTLMAVLSDVEPNYFVMLETLKQYRGNKAFPWMTNVVEMLQQSDQMMRNAFVESMTKHHASMFYIGISGAKGSYNVVVKNANRNSVIERITDTWNSSILDSDLVIIADSLGEENQQGDSDTNEAISDIQFQYNKAVIDDKVMPVLDSILDAELSETGAPVDIEGTKDNIRNLFKAMSIDVTEDTISDIVNGQITDRFQNPIPFVKHVGTTFRQIKNAFKISDRNFPLHSIITNQGIFRLLSANESSYVKNVYDNAFRSGNSTIWSNTQNNYISDRMRELRSDSDLLNLLLSDEYSEDSTWLNALFNKDTNDFRRNNFTKEFSLGYASLEAYNQKGSKFKPLDESTEGEYETAKVNFYLNSARKPEKSAKGHIAHFMYPTLSDKKKVTLIKALTESVEYNSDQKSITVRQAKIIYDRLVMPEIRRMLAQKDIDLQGYEKGRNIFFSFPTLNNIDELFHEGNYGERILKADIQSEYNELILNEITRVINEKIQNKVAKWNEYNIPIDATSLKVIGDGNIENVAADYVINYMIANMNIQQMFNIDPAKYYKERVKNAESYEDLILNINETLDNVGKRLAGHNAPGNYFNRDKNEKIRYLILPTQKVDMAEYDYIVEKYKNAYKGVDSTDAQEFTTWNEHLRILAARGQLTQSQYSTLLKKGQEGTLTNSDLSKFVFGAMKPVYMGSRLDENTSTEVPFYVKSSSFPLIPQLVKGTKLEPLMNRMKEEQIDRIAFTSAVKAGLPKEVTEAGSVIDVSISGFKIQQEVPLKDSEEVVDGTQKRKLIFVNLDRQSKVGNTTVGNLQDEYNETYGQLFQASKEKLLRSVSDQNGNISSRKLIELIKREALDRGYNPNELIGFEEVYNNETESFQLRVPLAFSSSNVKVQNLVNSLVDKRIRQITRPGSSLVLVSEENFVADDSKSKSHIRYVKGHDKTNRLKKGEVILPWPKSFGNINNYLQEDGTLKELPKWMSEVIGYRIPTQGHNSMDAMTVVGFIDPAIKTNAVLTSAHYIAQMGQDFDVDKLYIHRKSSPDSEKENEIAALKNKLFDIENQVLRSGLKTLKETGQEPIQHDRLKSISSEYTSVSGANSALDEEYQTFKYLNARSAKSAIGVFSSLSVMLAQSQGKNLFFQDVLYSSEEPTFFEVKFKVAGQDNNSISNPKTVSGNRFKSSVISSYQSASMDNEKDQILDKLNINNHTFEAINALLASGYEEDVISVVTNQPIVKEYVKQLEKYSSAYYNNSDAEAKALEETKKLFGIVSTEAEADGGNQIITQPVEDYDTKDVSTLNEYLNNPNPSNQLSAIDNFLFLTNLGRSLKSVNSTINFESKGLASTVYENLGQLIDIFNLKDYIPIANAEKLIGDYTTTVDETDEKELAQKIQDKLTKLYPEIKLNITNNPIWEQGDNVFNQEEYNNQVNYRLKATEKILDNLTKIKQWESNKSINQDTLWKKIGDLGISKQQLELLKESEGNTVEEKLASFVANYSFVVDIDTATDRKAGIDRWSGREEDLIPLDEEAPTQYYSNLTVPGGTNYTENEIATPVITPSIKGHAEFSTDNGIGWFRSDEQNQPLSGELDYEVILKGRDGWDFEQKVAEYFNLKEPFVTKEQKLQYLQETVDKRLHIEGSKTRRILEVQSDLFQKGRDKEELANVDYIYNNLLLEQKKLSDNSNLREAAKEELDQAKKELSKNQFLQLLNKNNNWVTFFVKSIIQDSAKKGYEKVLFPKGDTAAKIEGHQTLEEFKKQKEDRIKYLEENPTNIADGDYVNEVTSFNFNGVIYDQGSILTIRDGEAVLKDGDKTKKLSGAQVSEFFDETGIIPKKVSDTNEIKTLKQELANVESGQIQLSNIANFYETAVTNILKKNGYSPVEITDEYGNKWNEISINQARDLANIMLQRNEANQIIGQANIKAGTVLIDAINQKQDTLPHEYAHHYIAWFRNTPIVQEAIKKWGSEEALVQSIGEQAVKQKGEAWNWWNNFVKWIMNKFNSLSKLQKEELTQILTDAFLTRQDLGSKQGIEGFKTIDQNTKIQDKQTSPGFYTSGNVTITPNTIYGHANLAILDTNVKLFESHFPILKNNASSPFSRLVNSIVLDSKRLESNKNRAQGDIRTKIWSSYKAFILSRVASDVLGKDLQSEYNRILFDEAVLDPETQGIKEFTRKSLARRIVELRSSNKRFASNPVIERLKIDLRNPSAPKLIKYLNSAGESVNELKIHAGFVDLLRSKDDEIRSIAEDLVTYSLITGGDRSFTDFNKYIPVEYLEQIGVLKSLRNAETLINDPKSFYIQYFQNNPNEAQTISKGDLSKIFDVDSKSNALYIKDKEQVSKEDLRLIKRPGTKAFRQVLLVDNNGSTTLYHYNGRYYTPISKAGFGSGFTEMLPNVEGPIISINPANRIQGQSLSIPSQIKTPSMEQEQEKEIRNIRKPLYDVYSAVNYSENETSKFIDEIPAETEFEKEYVKLLKKQKLSTSVVINDTDTTGKYNGSYNNDTDTITLYLNSHNDTRKLVKTTLHELSHAALNKKLSNTSEANKKELKRLRTVVKNRIAAKYNISVEQATSYDKMRAALKEAKVSGETLLLVKSLFDETNKEFVAEVMSSKFVQDQLKSITDIKTKKTVYNQLAELFMKILGIKPDTVLANSFNVIMEVMSADSEQSQGTSKRKTPMVTVKVGDRTYKINKGDSTVYDENGNQVTDEQEVLKTRFKHNKSLGKLVKDTNNKLFYVILNDSLLKSDTNGNVSEVLPNTEEYSRVMSKNQRNDNDDITKDVQEIQGDNPFDAMEFLRKNISNDTPTDQIDFSENLFPDDEEAGNSEQKTDYDNVDSDTTEEAEDNEAERFYKLSNFKKLQLRNLRRQEINAKSNNDRAELERIAKRKEKLESEIEELQKIVLVEDLINIGIRDLEEVEHELSQNYINDSQLRELRKIVSLWERGIDIFFSESEKLSNNLLNKYIPIANKANYLTNVIYRKEVEVMQKYVNKTLNKNYSIEELLNFTKDIGSFEREALSIDRYGQAVLDAISKSIKDANQRARDEAETLISQVDEVSEVVRKKLKGDWSIFFQEYSTGEETGNLVFRYSQEYFDTRNDLLFKAKKHKKGTKASKIAWKKYFDFKNKNEVTFDIRKLFPVKSLFKEETDIKLNEEQSSVFQEGSPEINKHIALLKSHLGEKGYQEMVKRQKELLQKYEEDYQYEKTKINSESISIDEKRAKLKDWVTKNSPYKAAQSVNTKSTVTDIFENTGHRYLKSVPRRDVEGGKWYDSKFNTIENDPELLQVYEFIIDTFGRLYKILPADVTEKIQVNTLPEIKKTIVELFSENKGIGIEAIWNQVIESTTDKTGGEVQSGVIDPETGVIDTRNLRVEHLPNKEKLSQIALKKRIAFREKNSREPNEKEKAKLYREAKQEVAAENTSDIGKMLKAFAITTLAYKHKSRIEDQVRIAQDVINKATENELVAGTDTKVKDREGQEIKKTKDKSYENIRKSLDYTIGTALYGEGYKKEGIFGERKARTPIEKRNEIELNGLIKLLEEQFEAGIITDKTYQVELKKLTDELEANKSQRSVSSIGDSVLKTVQLKGMGWNLVAAIANLGFGGIANYVEAAGGELYTVKELNKANSMVLSSIGKNYGLNTPLAKKIRALMNSYDVLKEQSYELYKPSISSKMNKFFKRFMPYQLSKHTEYLNQAPLMVATMLHKKVKDKNGKEISLWEAYDKDGKWNTELMGENTAWKGDPNNDSHNTERLTYKSMLDSLIAKNHGNYDPDTPVKGKEAILGRMLLQFRTWALEGVHNRFGKDYFDNKLGVQREGRYRTIWNLINRNDFSIMKSLISKAERGKLDEKDKANMRRNFAELLIYTTMTSLILALKAASEDDEEEAFMTNILTNVLFRVSNDITFYINPESAYDVLRQPVPAVRLFTDIADVLGASWRLILGDDEIQGGYYDGDSRIVKEVTEFLPLASQGKRIVDSASRIY